MRKILVIIGFVVCAVAMEAVVFYLTSRVTPEEEQFIAQAAEKAPPKPTTFDEMMELAAEYSDQRRFEGAYGYLQLALDNAKTEQQRGDASFQMGKLLYDDYRHGGASDLESVALYLQAAFASTREPEKIHEIGSLLLNVFDDSDEKDKFMAYLEKMLSSNLSPEETSQLWLHKLEFLINQPDGWIEMNQALAEAENRPNQDAQWDKTIAELKLRTREKLLADEGWYRSYDDSMGMGSAVETRMELATDIREELGRRYKDADWHTQADVLLRLARTYVAVGDYNKGHDYLRMFLDMEPTENLSEALVLHSQISRVRGDPAYAAELAKSLIRRFDFDDYTRDEVLQVVQLLEENKLYDDALDLLESCFSMTERLSKEYAILLRRAAVLEERMDHRSTTLSYMTQLRETGASREFDKAVTELIDYNMAMSDYEAVEKLIHRFMGQIFSGSDDYKNALFSLFESKYWLDRPVIEQLFIGSLAVQTAPEDPRSASVELRMARYIEGMKLYNLAISYYNRIGLLNFFQSEPGGMNSSQNLGEQAMLGKARCLKQLEDWAAADHLYREICKRTKSPMVKSEAAVGWGELALRFSQRREAQRRLDLAYAQMLSETDQVRYMLACSRIDAQGQFDDPVAVEDNLDLLSRLPSEEQQQSTILFFNDSFEYFYNNEDEESMLNIINFACENDFADQLPIQSYLLRLHEDRFQNEQISGLGPLLRDKNEVAGASVMELAQVADRIEKLASMIERYKRKAIQ